MKDTFILRLLESKNNPNLLPDEICNILQNYLFERKKLNEMEISIDIKDVK